MKGPPPEPLPEPDPAEALQEPAPEPLAQPAAAETPAGPPGSGSTTWIVAFIALALAAVLAGGSCRRPVFRPSGSSLGETPGRLESRGRPPSGRPWSCAGRIASTRRARADRRCPRRWP